MPPKKKVTLTDSQKYELCLYANNNKRTRFQYVNWIEQKWGLRVDESTITRILQTKDKRLTTEVIKPVKKRHGIHQIKLHGEADSADKNAIAEALPLLRYKCAEYPLDRIYNMDEIGLFYQYFLILYYFCININNCIIFSH